MFFQIYCMMPTVPLLPHVTGYVQIVETCVTAFIQTRRLLFHLAVAFKAGDAEEGIWVSALALTPHSHAAAMLRALQ